MEEQNNIMTYKIAITLLTEGLVAKGVDIFDIPIILKGLAKDYENEIELQTKEYE
jgi:hypothetical protein